MIIYCFGKQVLLFDYVHFCHPNYIYKYNLHFSIFDNRQCKQENGYVYTGN